MTGTPVENHLGDLWSIFEFLNPGMLGSHVKFNEMLKAGAGGGAVGGGGMNGGGAGGSEGSNGSSSAGDGARVVEQAARALRPFILRRTKEQVLDDLPPKTEQTIVCDMETAQQALYDELRVYYRSRLMTQLDGSQDGGAGGDLGAAAAGEGGGGGSGGSGGRSPSRGLGKSAFIALEALLRLRQAACHPGLVDEARKPEPSAKLDTLFDMLDEVLEEGGKALVFSQFTSMLSIVRDRMDERGMKYCYLDGQTRDRRREVDRFQTDPSIPVFLISLKAGGFGLNLTSAEYVFILDPWWNPAVEAQAIDRAHRIGQTRPVFAYRLVCRDTVEQRILELQRRKRELADAIIGGEQSPISELTREDLEQLLS